MLLRYVKTICLDIKFYKLFIASSTMAYFHKLLRLFQENKDNIKIGYGCTLLF